ncbi:MAG: hypothetical protein FWE04_05840, partial [Oscillospiraceae bacterium]|nr:hypothetical protein [Oscillospiraceae bacterium]
MERVKRGQLNKILALMVVFAMLILVVPVTASADTYEVFDESYESALSYETEFIWDDNDLFNYIDIEASYIGIVPASGVNPAVRVIAGTGWSPSSGVVPGTTFTWVGPRANSGRASGQSLGPGFTQNAQGWIVGTAGSGNLSWGGTFVGVTFWPIGNPLTVTPTTVGSHSFIWSGYTSTPTAGWITSVTLGSGDALTPLRLPSDNGSIQRNVQPPQATPAPPTMNSRAAAGTSITLAPVSNSVVSGVTWINQFRHRPQGGTWGDWTTANVRTGLTPGGMYEFQRRWVAGANTGGNNATYHSNESNAAQFRAVPAAPDAPTMTNRSTTSVTISAAPLTISQFVPQRERRIFTPGTGWSTWAVFTGDTINVTGHAQGVYVEVRQRHARGTDVAHNVDYDGPWSTANATNGRFRAVPVTPTPTAYASTHNTITIAALPTVTQFTAVQEWRLYPAGTFVAVPANRVISVPEGAEIEVRQQYVRGAPPFNVDFDSEWAYATLKHIPPTFQIWNWADLAQVMEMQNDHDYTHFVLMQDLGIPNDPTTFGDGAGLMASQLTTTHQGNRRYGWFGFQGFEGLPGGDVSGFSSGYLGNLHGWQGAQGWTPISTGAWPNMNPFAGNFDGQNFEISGLWMNRTQHVSGLFGYVLNATIANLGVNILEDEAVRGTVYVGGFVGILTNSNISNSFVTGDVSGTSSAVGGFVGKMNDSEVTDSFATGDVNGFGEIGGFVGWLESSTIIDSHAIGDVTGLFTVGGFAGYVENGSEIIDSSATGDVTGNLITIGGFVGWLEGSTITDSHATGAVMGQSSVGGFVGHVYNSEVSNSHAIGYVTGSQDVGGFVGKLEIGIFEDNYATGDVTGSYYVGGFAGIAGGFGGGFGDITITDSHATGNVIGETNVGGFAGTLHETNVTNSYATGVVEGNTEVGGFAGAIVQSEITDNFATGDVSGRDNIGGFAGATSGGEITNSFATGDVTGEFNVGGFVGDVGFGEILNSYATGNVAGERSIGGFVGHLNGGNIKGSFALGDVTGVDEVGGFAGILGWGEITGNFAIGNVTGVDEVGGFVGAIHGPSHITNSYATGRATGNTNVGGFVGRIFSYVAIIADSYAAVTVTGDMDIGGFVGWNLGSTAFTNIHFDEDVAGVGDNYAIAQATDFMTSAAFAATLGGAFVYRTEEFGEFRGRHGNITPGIDGDWTFYPQLVAFAPVGGELADLYTGNAWTVRNRWSIISVIVFDEPDG